VKEGPWGGTGHRRRGRELRDAEDLEGGRSRGTGRHPSREGARGGADHRERELEAVPTRGREPRRRPARGVLRGAATGEGPGRGRRRGGRVEVGR